MILQRAVQLENYTGNSLHYDKAMWGLLGSHKHITPFSLFSVCNALSFQCDSNRNCILMQWCCHINVIITSLRCDQKIPGL